MAAAAQQSGPTPEQQAMLEKLIGMMTPEERAAFDKMDDASKIKMLKMMQTRLMNQQQEPQGVERPPAQQPAQGMM